MGKPSRDLSPPAELAQVRTALLCLWLVGVAWTQSLPEEVQWTVHSFPASEIYLDTARGPSYLGKSSVLLRMKPPSLLDGAGRPVQYVNGYLILKARDHGDLRVPVAAQEWDKGRLPVGGGSYRLTPNSAWVAATDAVTGYPMPFAVGLVLLAGGLAKAHRWRREARHKARENLDLSRQLQTTGDPLLGKKLGSYTVLSRLGQGGMGSVYRVSDANGGEWAAKVLYFDDPVAQELQRFRREFRVLQQLSHPALLRAFDYGEEAGMAYCICEFVQGRTLNHYLRPQGQPWSTIWPWVEGILEGLSCAHQAGVVHRDLKPSNIMISESGVKILDFGLARQAQITAVTLTGQAFGTPTYMAPEQISASGTEVDVRSDLYSLGIILFELVSGRPPFQADDVQDIITQHLTLAPPPLSSRATDVPEGLDAVVSTLLAKKPANRYASAQRVLEVLRGLNTGPAQAAETADQTLPSPDTLPVVRRSREGGANC